MSGSPGSWCILWIGRKSMAAWLFSCPASEVWAAWYPLFLGTLWIADNLLGSLTIVHSISSSCSSRAQFDYSTAIYWWCIGRCINGILIPFCHAIMACEAQIDRSRNYWEDKKNLHVRWSVAATSYPMSQQQSESCSTSSDDEKNLDVCIRSAWSPYSLHLASYMKKICITMVFRE